MSSPHLEDSKFNGTSWPKDISLIKFSWRRDHFFP